LKPIGSFLINKGFGFSIQGERGLQLEFREAAQTDLKQLVHLLADDVLGADREDASEPLNMKYSEAFSAINSDPNNELVVVEHAGTLVGMLQLTFIPYLTHTGAWRCLIEGVRIRRDFRGQGLGSQLFEWAIDRAKAKGCKLVQLTSDKQRPDAIRFYEGLGFKATHEGLKLMLN
jgi:GNAT superfamily N-acetyltransferase